MVCKSKNNKEAKHHNSRSSSSSSSSFTHGWKKAGITRRLSDANIKDIKHQTTNNNIVYERRNE
jgi:predicted DNA binding CopG/RHH family protein